MPFLRDRNEHFTPSTVQWLLLGSTKLSLGSVHALDPAGLPQERAETSGTSFKPPGLTEDLTCGSGHMQGVPPDPSHCPTAAWKPKQPRTLNLSHSARFFSPLLLMSVPGAIPEITRTNSWLAIFGSSSPQGKREITLWAIQASWQAGHKHTF